MNGAKPQFGLGEGVYYACGDYAGIVRRLLIFSIDLVVILFGAIAIQVAFEYLPWQGKPGWLPVATWLGLSYLYLTVLKPSPIRTLGYLLCRAQIVTLSGGRPSFVRMTWRLLLILIFHPIFDLIWVGIDDDRQSLRDRYAGTCETRYKARPLGHGAIHLTHYFAAGYALMFPKVMRR